LEPSYAKRRAEKAVGPDLYDKKQTALLCGQHSTVINRTQMADDGKPYEIEKQFCLWLWAIIEETDVSNLQITLRKSSHFPVALLNFSGLQLDNRVILH
jgi:hypothetical protein